MLPQMIVQTQQLVVGVDLILGDKEHLSKWQINRLNLTKIALQKTVKYLKELQCTQYT